MCVENKTTTSTHARARTDEGEGMMVEIIYYVHKKVTFYCRSPPSSSSSSWNGDDGVRESPTHTHIYIALISLSLPLFELPARFYRVRTQNRSGSTILSCFASDACSTRAIDGWTADELLCHLRAYTCILCIIYPAISVRGSTELMRASPPPPPNTNACSANRSPCLKTIRAILGALLKKNA